MIYAKHNFAENFMNADGLTFGLDRDMVISELAKVINANPIGVKDAIFDCGVNIDPMADKFEISEVMSGNMANNECLQRAMGHLILDNNVGWNDLLSFSADSEEGVETDSDEYYNAKGDGWKKFWTETKKVVGSEQFAQVLGTTVGAIYTSKQQNKQWEQSEKIRQHELELAKINSEAINNQLSMGSTYGTPPPTGMSMGAKIGIGVGAVAVIGLIIFLAVRGKGGSRRR